MNMPLSLEGMMMMMMKVFVCDFLKKDIKERERERRMVPCKDQSKRERKDKLSFSIEYDMQ